MEEKYFFIDKFPHPWYSYKRNRQVPRVKNGDAGHNTKLFAGGLSGVEIGRGLTL